MEKMAIINTFGPVLLNDGCIGYILADQSLNESHREVFYWVNVYESLNFIVTIVVWESSPVLFPGCLD